MERFTFTPTEGLLILEVGHVVSRLAALRAAGCPVVKDEVLLSRLLAALVGQLRMEE